MYFPLSSKHIQRPYIHHHTLTCHFASYANPVAMEAIGWKYYIVYCCVIFVELWIIYFLFPETRGRTLEEVAEIFDNDQTFLERTRNSKKHVRKGLRAGNA